MRGLSAGGPCGGIPCPRAGRLAAGSGCADRVAVRPDAAAAGRPAGIVSAPEHRHDPSIEPDGDRGCKGACGPRAAARRACRACGWRVARRPVHGNGHPLPVKTGRRLTIVCRNVTGSAMIRRRLGGAGLRAAAEIPPPRAARPYRPPPGRPPTLPCRRPRRDGRQPCGRPRTGRSTSFAATTKVRSPAAGPPCPYGRPSGTGSAPALRSRPPPMPSRPTIPMTAPTTCPLGTSSAYMAEIRLRRLSRSPRAGEGAGAADAGG